MSSFFTILLIAISLSMDAFSLSLGYGIIIRNQKSKVILSLIVGLYHFIMPLIGLALGNYIDTISFINLKIIAVIILLYIGLDLIFSKHPQEDSLLIGPLMFGLSVSLDSLTIGIGLKAITSNYLISAFMFSITSLFFTYIGLILGNIIGKNLGTYSKIVGGIILIIIAIIMFVK